MKIIPRKLRHMLLTGMAIVGASMSDSMGAKAQSSNELSGGFSAEMLSIPKYTFQSTYLNTWARVKFNSDPSDDNTIRPYISTDARFQFREDTYGFSNRYGFSYNYQLQKYFRGWQVGFGIEGQKHLTDNTTIRPYIEVNHPVTEGMTYGLGGKAGCRLEIGLSSNKGDVIDRFNKNQGISNGQFRLIADIATGAEHTVGPSGNNEWVRNQTGKFGIIYTF